MIQHLAKVNVLNICPTGVLSTPLCHLYHFLEAKLLQALPVWAAFRMHCFPWSLSYSVDFAP